MMESIYKSYSMDQLQELFSNFLIESWSYSKVSSFARNEKAFEMQSIYGLYSRSSATTIAGNAYHTALEYYFNQKKEGKELDLVELEASAFQYLDGIGANKWKLQKTTPTIESAKEKATKTVTALLKNFAAEKGVYEDDIQEILHVELYCDEFLTVNGVDIPLPCHLKIDLVVRTKAGKIAIVDHKSKSAFTDDEEVGLSIGVQAITYVLGYEARFGEQVDEVWFVENKYSSNKEKGTAQLVKFPIEITTDIRRLYEALLYEPLKRMVEAVSNPDYIYLINDADNYVSKAELYDFWYRTMICEIEDFNVEESKKALVAQRLKKVRDASLSTITPAVIKKFKDNAATFIQYDLSTSDMTQEQKIEHVLRTFGTTIRVAHKFSGYSSNTFLLEFSAGVKISSIYNHRLDIANALDVANVRIGQDLTVYEGKSYLGIDFAKKREGSLYFNPDELKGRKIPLGKDNFNNTIYWDLDNHSTPHMLVCGATGSGKSVCIRSVIEYGKLAGMEKIVVLDPKFEFTHLRGGNVEVFNSIEEIEEVMKKLVGYMNWLTENRQKCKVMVVFDEFADAVASSRSGNDLKVYAMEQVGNYADGSPKMARRHVDTDKSLEENLRIILQKGRSIGFRIVAATQRASVKVITGDAKVNFPIQVCFWVPKEADSRVVLDEPGAEGLAGQGDGLIKSPEYKDTVRFQAFYYDEKQMATT